MRDLIEQFEKFWCETMHTGVMWPIHGRYRCSTCLREYAVEFEGSEPWTPAGSSVAAPLSGGAFLQRGTASASRALLTRNA
jgi:hypothetical protein